MDVEAPPPRAHAEVLMMRVLSLGGKSLPDRDATIARRSEVILLL